MVLGSALVAKGILWYKMGQRHRDTNRQGVKMAKFLIGAHVKSTFYETILIDGIEFDEFCKLSLAASVLAQLGRYACACPVHR